MRSEPDVSPAEELHEPDFTHYPGTARALPNGSKRRLVRGRYHAPTLPKPLLAGQLQARSGQSRPNAVASFGRQDIQVPQVSGRGRKLERKRPQHDIRTDPIRQPRVAHR